MNDARGEMTQLLHQLDEGGASEPARHRLFEIAYEELRNIADGLMRRERADHTLQPTALVNEAAMRLLDADALSNKRAESRAYFFGAMANAMRRVLVDHARRSRADRRGGDRPRYSLDVAIDFVEGEQGIDLLELNDAIDRLAALSERQSEIVVLRFFGGMSIPDLARHLEVSESTVEKDWRMARAWLRRELGES